MSGQLKGISTHHVGCLCVYCSERARESRVSADRERKKKKRNARASVRSPRLDQTSPPLHSHADTSALSASDRDEQEREINRLVHSSRYAVRRHAGGCALHSDD